MKLTALAVAWMVWSVPARPQGSPEFEVASVKAVAAESRRTPAILPRNVRETMGFKGGPGTHDPGRIDYTEVSLQMLLARAYNVRSDQVVGPDWLDSESYTIAAKLPPDTDAAQLRLMLQKLLTERFQLGFHREMKEMPVYRLLVAKNGPKLKPPEETSYEDAAARMAATKKQTEENAAKMKAEREANARNGIKNLNSRRFSMSSATLEKFAEFLSGHLDRPVRDMTHIEGKYSFQLAWNPEHGPSTNADEPAGVSVFAAIQEQLGLKLEAGKEATELLVVDKAEKTPTSN